MTDTALPNPEPMENDIYDPAIKLPLGTIFAEVLPIALLNRKMPSGFRFEHEEALRKNREIKEAKPAKKKKISVIY